MKGTIAFYVQFVIYNRCTRSICNHVGLDLAFLVAGLVVIKINYYWRNLSVIVLDNASYHNIKTEETVVSNFNQRKAVLQDYFSKHNIPFQPLETKKQLYEKIKFKNHGVQFAMANRGS
jgi:hypothetical protein